MNKEITIIELVNKIANGEKVPQKIKYNYVVYEYKETPQGTGYVNEYDNRKFWLANKIDIDDKEKLNSKIEILEEDKDIEEIDLADCRGNGECVISVNDEKIQNKINELVKEVNKLKKE